MPPVFLRPQSMSGFCTVKLVFSLFAPEYISALIAAGQLRANPSAGP